MILSLHQIENTTKSLINIMCRLLSNGESDIDNSDIDESDNEFTDGSDSDFNDVCDDFPLWLALTDFDYRWFYLNRLIPRFSHCIGQPCIFGNETMSVIFSFQDAAECALLFDYIYAYFGSYNYCPEVRYHDGDLVTSIHVPWLGGCIAECLLDPDGNVTNNIVCLINSQFC